MLEDDTDDKVRRNFVAISTIICVTWLIDVDLAKVAMGLLKIDGALSNTSNSNARIWLLLAVMLLYTAHRFQYTEATKKSSVEVIDGYRGRLQRIVDPTLAIDHNGFAKTPEMSPLLLKARKVGETSTSLNQREVEKHLTLVTWGLPTPLIGAACLSSIQLGGPTSKKTRAFFWLPRSSLRKYASLHWTQIVRTVQSQNFATCIFPAFIGSIAACHTGDMLGQHWLSGYPLATAAACLCLLLGYARRLYRYFTNYQ